MNNGVDPNWEPDAQWLAAYFDGEFEGRADLAEMRARVEAWLEAHPEALDECAGQRNLQQLWLDTTPAEPTDDAWQRCRDGIDARRAAYRPARRRSWLTRSALAAAILLTLGALFGYWRSQQVRIDDPPSIVVAPKEETFEVFEVAQASEITILRVEGADTDSLVVGTPPLAGLLELAEHGDVDVLHMCPDARDQLPNVRERGRPLIWARIDVDK